MQSHAVHDLVHDEGRTCHVARVFHERDEAVENENLRQEDDDGSHTSDDTVDEHVFQRSFGHQRIQPVAQVSYARLYPVHGILAEREGGLEHEPHHGNEERNAHVAVGQDVVYEVSGLIDVFLRTRIVACLLQGTVNETIFRIHDGGFAVLVEMLMYVFGGLVAQVQNLLAVGNLLDVVLNLLVVFEQFDGNVSGGESATDTFRLFQGVLHGFDSLFDVAAVVDVQMSGCGFRTFGNGGNGTEKLFHTSTGGKDRRHHRYSEQGAQLL